MVKFLAASIIFLPLLAFAQVNKCKMPDGSVVYSDVECPSASRNEVIIEKKNDKKQDAKTGFSDLEKDFDFSFKASGNKGEDYLTLLKHFENIKFLGETCGLLLRSNLSDRPACKLFSKIISPGGVYEKLIDDYQAVNNIVENVRRKDNDRGYSYIQGRIFSALKIIEGQKVDFKSKYNFN